MKTEIEKHSPEWRDIHYRIQLIMGLPAALPLKIYKFNNADQHIQELRHKYPNKTLLDAHLNLSVLDQSTQRKILQKKYKMSNLIIETGHLSIQIQSKQTRKSSLWLLKAAVGDSYCVQTSNPSDVPSTIPEPYDSLYLCSNQNQQLYRHDYILREPDQYVLEYEVLFTLEKSRQYNVRQIICNKCQRRSAMAYCKQQQAFFCSECNVIHHRDKLLASHTREELTKFNTIDLCKQPNHNKRMELYCETCEKAMCIECTISGWHSNKEFASHQTKALKKYYEQKLVENEDLSKMRKAELSETLKRIEDTIGQINLHAVSLEKRITQLYESTLKDLRQNTKAKLDKLLVVKTETKRQYDQLVWTDSFIKYQQQLLKPLYYLEVQKQYEIFKEELTQTPLKPLPKINPNNLDIEGEIRLVQIETSYKKDYMDHQETKYNRDKSHSRSSNKSFNSKFPTPKAPFNSKHKSPSEFNTHSQPHNQQTQTPNPKSGVRPPRPSNNTDVIGTYAAPILEATLRNANFTSIKFQ